MVFCICICISICIYISICTFFCICIPKKFVLILIFGEGRWEYFQKVERKPPRYKSEAGSYSAHHQKKTKNCRFFGDSLADTLMMMVMMMTVWPYSNDTDTDTFSRHKIFLIPILFHTNFCRYRYSFRVPNFFDINFSILVLSDNHHRLPISKATQVLLTWLEVLFN